MKIDKNIKNLIRQALKEDIGKGDVTTNILILPNMQVNAVIIAKGNGVICGLDVTKAVFTQLDKNIKFKALVGDGDRVAAGRNIARISGSARAILTAERTALNFLGHLSGIATLTRQFVDRVKPYKVKIMDTRKTIPGLRILEKYAVKCGGGINHRMGLWDAVLVKENHFHIFSRGKNKKIKEAIGKIRKKIPRNKKIEVEVETLKELKEALDAKVDIILLDNMNIGLIKKAVALRGNRKALFEVSGRVNLTNVRQIANTGIDRISVGSLTHSAKALDLSLDGKI